VTELCKDWDRESALHEVIFESALSLRRMIEAENIDLNPDFAIKFIDCDCALDFPGYFLEAVEGSNDVFHLTRK
jgi:hypothetical protein